MLNLVYRCVHMIMKQCLLIKLFYKQIYILLISANFVILYEHMFLIIYNNDRHKVSFITAPHIHV